MSYSQVTALPTLSLREAQTPFRESLFTPLENAILFSALSMLSFLFTTADQHNVSISADAQKMYQLKSLTFPPSYS